MSQINIQARFLVDNNTWPPEQPASFTPLLLLHYQGHRTKEQVAATANIMCTGNISKVTTVTDNYSAVKHLKLDNCENIEKVLDACKATKEIEDILAPLEMTEESCFILIEGAPGIGKSVLLQEIAYRWGKKQLLQKYDLVLLVRLRDPSVQQIMSVNDLLQLFCIGDENSARIVSVCVQYFSANGGKSLILLLDGYDEYPGHLRENSLIANFLKHRVLPFCGIIVSSRPHASEHFHRQATIRVDILGFTEAEREHYIKKAFPHQPYKIKELIEYLHQHPFIDSICYSPFNMVILLYLYKMGISPKNSSEMYHHFVCSTILRHLSKFHNPFVHNITDLTNLPDPYNTIIEKLSKLSLESLGSEKLVFTYDEITAACSEIATVPEAINGLGLLQAVQHFGPSGKNMTMHFIHFTIQEFLAVHYMSQLPCNKELEEIKKIFWRSIHLNMFSIYISLTKGQRASFKNFLSGGNDGITISDKFLRDPLKCLHLYHCFNEANDHVMCHSIEDAEIFSHKEINLIGKPLTGSDLGNLSLFIASSFNKEWARLGLINCQIQDKGLNILCRGLCHSNNIFIHELWLENNGLTTQSSSLISNFTVNCKVKVLWLTGNHTVGDNEQLYSMLTNPSNVLEQLYMRFTSLSASSAIYLFTALRKNNKLKQLYIEINNINDDASDAIISALEVNKCLVKLSMYRNPLSSKAIINIVQCLESNDTLKYLMLPNFAKDVQKSIVSLQQVVNKKRESKSQIKLKIEFWHV